MINTLQTCLCCMSCDVLFQGMMNIVSMYKNSYLWPSPLLRPWIQQALTMIITPTPYYICSLRSPITFVWTSRQKKKLHVFDCSSIRSGKQCTLDLQKNNNFFINVQLCSCFYPPFMLFRFSYSFQLFTTWTYIVWLTY